MLVRMMSTTDSICPNERVLISAKELAELLGVSIRTLWRLRSGGQLPLPVRLGHTVRWRMTDIETWLAAGCPGSRAD